MLRYVYVLLSLMLFSPLSNSETQSPENYTKVHYDWDCWGWKKAEMRDSSKNTSVSLSTDVCVRKDVRPLTVDVYLHKISFNGSYNELNIDMLVSATHKLTGKQQLIRHSDTVSKANEYVKRFEFPAIRSGDYDINISQIWLTFRNSGKPTGSFNFTGAYYERNGTGYIKGANPNAMWDMIKNAKAETITNGKPSHIVFGNQYEVPMNTGKGEYTMAIPGNMLIIPRVYNNQKYVIPHLLGDTHTGEAARCEGMPNARTSDNTLEQAELYTPQQAWLKLNKPLVALNANYFDVRPQLNGTTWASNLCSVPLGIYFDNIANGPTDGTHNSPNKYFAGPEYFIGDNNEKIALDAMYWIMDSDSTMQIYYSTTPADPAIERRAKEIELSGYKFLAIAGSGLPNRALNPEPTPDSGATDTTRLVISADSEDSVLYIFEGGKYVNGVNRNDLYWLFYGLGVPNALELDGGGSAALALDSNAFTLKGDNRPVSSCNQLGLWCSPITQPDGKPRPVPSWLGLSTN